MLRAVAKNGGVVMVNFYNGFVDPRKAENALRERSLQDELNQKYAGDSQRVQEELRRWREANNPGKTPLSMLIDHFDHIIKVAGIDHVGIGSDFDGITSVPQGLEDVSRMPYLLAELLDRGWSRDDLAKLCGANLLRVLRANEVKARELRSARPASDALIEELDPPASKAATAPAPPP